MAGRDRAATILLTKAMGIRASVTTVSPGVAVPAVAVLGAGGSVMPNLVAGIATCPGLDVPGAVGANMAHMATHGAKVVHVNDGGGWKGALGGAVVRGRSDGGRIGGA